MYIHEEAKAVYLAHPRTASRTTSRLLHSIGFERSRWGPDGGHHAKLSPLPGSRKDWTVFTTVRNHWDAMVSYHFHLVVGAGRKVDKLTVRDVERACKANRWVVRPDRLWDLHGPDADRILKFESIDKDLNAVLRDVGLPGVEWPKTKPIGLRDGRAWENFYTEESYNYVLHKFREEINHYGY